jgi:hypothetical protein
MTDDRFEDFLKDVAQSYNAPPPTPRDQIWDRIEGARRAEREGRTIVHPARFRRTWAAWVGAVAAALLVGIGIGRWSESSPDAPPAGDVAVNDRPSIDGPSTAPDAPAPAPSVADPQPGAAPNDRRRDPETPVPVRSPQLDARSAGRGPAYLPDTPEPAAMGAAYRVAAIRHLGQAEALLTSFRSESRAGRLDGQVSAWADDLLSTTRLLLDSPAAADPRMRRLLDDLELVLAQIAQLPSQREERELELIGRSVEERNMLTRLRSAVPSGLVPSGT